MSLLIIKHLKVLYKTVNVSKHSIPSEMQKRLCSENMPLNKLSGLL